MNLRRGEKLYQDIQLRQNDLINRFQVGDIVVPYFAPANDFYGVVTNVNTVENKVYVDFAGTVRQLDPNELRIVLKYVLQKNSRRANKMLKRKREAIYHAETGRKYKVTKKEQDSGKLNCPKCKSEMWADDYARDKQLYTCPQCNFKIRSDELVFPQSRNERLLNDEFLI